MSLDAAQERERQRRIRQSSPKQRTPQSIPSEPRIGRSPWTPIVLRSVDIESQEMWFHHLRYADRPPVIGSYEAFGALQRGYPLPTSRLGDYTTWVWPETIEDAETGEQVANPLSTETQALLAVLEQGYWIVMIPFITEASFIKNGAYVFGGYSETCGIDFMNDNSLYTPDRWTAKSPLMCPGRYDHAAAAVGNAVYSFGGNQRGPSVFLLDTDQYIPDGWSSKRPMPIPARHASAAFTLGDSAYVSGGYSSNQTPLKDTDRYTPPPYDSWATRAGYPNVVAQHAAFSVQDVGYMTGGGGDGISNETYAYTPDSWTRKADLPVSVGGARYRHKAFTIGELGYISGGQKGAPRVYVRDFIEYDPVDVWRLRHAMPSPVRADHVAASIELAGFVFYGAQSDALEISNTDEYTPSGDSWSHRAPGTMPTRSLAAGATL